MGIFRLLFVGALIYLAMRAVRQMLQPSAASATAARAPSRSRSPWEVLGVRADATQEQIRAAYQLLIQQYHPDRTGGLAPELQALAEERTKELNQAYAKLRQR
ncbi:MAG: J domain-containing protein [Myxococcota bacterium]